MEEKGLRNKVLLSHCYFNLLLLFKMKYCNNLYTLYIISKFIVCFSST